MYIVPGSQEVKVIHTDNDEFAGCSHNTSIYNVLSAGREKHNVNMQQPTGAELVVSTIARALVSPDVYKDGLSVVLLCLAGVASILLPMMVVIEAATRDKTV